jgi:pimeloyl-ACP methyl ester carboxylesterase
LTTGVWAKPPAADFAADAEAAIAYLKTRKEVNPRKTGIIGHSEGGLIAAMLAARDPSLSFVVLLAAPGVNGRTLTANQVASILQANGRTPAAVTAYQQLYRSLMDIAVAEKDSASTFHEGFAAYQLWKQQTPETVQKELFLGNDTLARRDVWKNLYTFRVPWFRYFMQAEPAQYLEKLQCSVLALNGEKDIQVNADENLAAIEQALKKSRARSFDIQKLPGLNHLFQHCTTCTTAEYMQLEETFSPGALAVMGNWLDRTIKNNP